MKICIIRQLKKKKKWKYRDLHEHFGRLPPGQRPLAVNDGERDARDALEAGIVTHAIHLRLQLVGVKERNSLAIEREISTS